MAVLNKAGSLPTIKCSNCGVDIDIERMTDHLCGPGLGSSIGKPPPRSFNDAFSNMSVNQSVPAPFRHKPILRPIDLDVANVPFLTRPPAPTGMQSYKRSAPSVMTGEQGIPTQRNAAKFPIPASPEFTLPQECAFPAFPLSQRLPPPSVYNRSNTDPSNTTKSSQISRIPSPGATGNNKPTITSRLQQMNTTKNSYEPFGSSASSRQLPFLDQRPSTSSPAITSMTYAQPTSHPVAPMVKTSEPASSQSRAHARNKSVSAANRPLDEIGSVRTHRAVPSRNEIPSQLSGPNIPRSASAQSHRYGRSVHENIPPIPGMYDANGQAIPRSASAMGSRDRKVYDTPPLPVHMQHYRPGSQNSTYHTPHDSTSSNQSENSQPATSSSRSSPPTSNASMSPQRRNRRETGNDQSVGMMGMESVRPMGGPAAKSFSRPSYAQPIPPLLSPETFDRVTAGPWQSEMKTRPRQTPLLSPDTFDQLGAGPWQSNTKTQSHKLSQPPDGQASYHTNGPYRDNPPYPPAPKSTLEPAFNGNNLPILNTRSAILSQSPEFQEATRSAVMPNTRQRGMFQDSLAPSLMPRTTLRRAATTSKGKCRGCAEVITGKSVSSADGRLTGRWHKQCFTCKTCSEPFPTMDFYVIGNDPYCNRHYHQLNKSLCTSCDRGIEGQYADNDRQKFHPHCFTCSECHLILRDTYFDLNGNIFCERHAFKADVLSPLGVGRRMPEKRSTRFMMI